MFRQRAQLLARVGLVAAIAGIAPALTAARAPALGAGSDWIAPQGGYDEASYSQLDEITAKNVHRLGLAWSLDLPSEITFEGTPLAVDGILYFSGGLANVYAVDSRTGKRLWTFESEAWKRSPYRGWTVNRGVAYENGRVFIAERDGRLNALDAKTGRVIWFAESIPKGLLNKSTGAPRVMNGKVIIGNGGADAGGVRGYVTAYDSATGKQLWRFFTVPGRPDENRGDPVMEAAARTWTGKFWEIGGGGTVWNAMTYDPETDRIYIGVGNGGPWDRQARSPEGGDNLFLVSVVALNATTGKYLWHYQENPGDSWDYKSTANIVSTTLKLDGKPRKVLLHAPTNGFFYVLDRETGKPISAGKTTEISWASGIDLKTGRPIENKNIRYEDGPVDMWPSSGAGHNWHAMSFNPRLGLAFIPVSQGGIRFSREPIEGASNYGGLWMTGTSTKRPGDGFGYLVAWDPARQREIWRVKHPYAQNGGVMSTAGGVVFQGTAQGDFDGYEGRTGKRLWQFNVGHGIISAPMSFSVDGRQYVSVLAGYGGTSYGNGNLGWKHNQPRRLLTFALDGKAQLQKSEPDYLVRALDDSGLSLEEADVRNGRAMWGNTCGTCHGSTMQAVGANGPDLRESRLALRLDTLSRYLRVGMPARGMPPFANLTETQVRELHAYIRANARDVIRNPPPTRAGRPADAERPAEGLH